MTPASVRFLCAAAATVLLTLSPAAAGAQAPAAPAEPVIVTTGEGLVQAVPDRAWIAVSAESRAANAREAQRRNAEAMRPVQDKLRGAGVPAEAIRTLSYDLQQEWDYVNDRRVSRGYVARNAIEIRVDDIERVGELLEIAVGSGATSVTGLRFDIKDRTRVEREALRLAVVQARGDAEAVAAAAGRSIDRIQRVEAHTVGAPVPMAFAKTMMREAAADAAPPISAGQIEVRAQVTLTSVMK